MSQAVISSAPTSRSILAGKGFRRLLGVRLTSQVADGLFQAGLAGSILFNPNQKSSPVEIAMGVAVLLLPYSVLGPYVGVLLDRWDRRASLSVANLARAVLVLPSAALLWNGSQGAGFAFFALLVIAINRFFLAGLSAALPRVVDDEKLVPANALAATLGTICYATGLVTAAGAVSLGLVSAGSSGYGAIAATASIGYLISGLLARRLFTRDSLGPLEHEKHTGKLSRAVIEVAQGMVAGIGHLMERRKAARAIKLQALYRLLYGVLTLAVLLLVSRYFGETPRTSLRDLGLVAIAGAAGAAVAASVTPIGVRRFGSARWLASLVAGVGVVVLVCGLPFLKLLILVATFLINVASQSMKIIVDATIQHEVEDIYRGRVFSVNDTAFNICFVGGLFITALSFPGNGRSVAGLLTVATGFVALAAWFAISSRQPSAAAPPEPAQG